MGTLDRVLRIAVAAGIIVLYALGKLSGPWTVAFLILAGVFIATSFVSFCPLYRPFGFTTRARQQP